MFPTTLVFYMTISLLVLGKILVLLLFGRIVSSTSKAIELASFFAEIFVLVSFLDRTALFCGSPDLAESLRTPTTFCTTSGTVHKWFCVIHGST